MSAEDDGFNRERAVRVFASELEDATGHNFKEDTDSDRAPVYTLLPTGVRVNRVVIIGAVTEVNEYDDSDFVRARVNDGDSNFAVNASSQYQREAAAALKELDPPEIVAIVGKVKHWENDEGEMNVEIQQLEEVVPVPEEERKEWVIATASRTRDRIQKFNETTQEEIDSGNAPDDIGMVVDEDSEIGYGDVSHKKYLQAAKRAINTTMIEDED